jgi:hypothetical protein
MATADSSTVPRASDFRSSFDLVDQVNACEPLFTLSQNSFLELAAILSAYSDLLILMDSGLPEYVFLQMLNDRFSRLVFSLPRLDAHAP